MCGIVGYIGDGDTVNILLESLRKLEYRGYDSAGMAIIDDKGKARIFKNEGEISELEAIVPEISSHVGIGHTSLFSFLILILKCWPT